MTKPRQLAARRVTLDEVISSLLYGHGLVGNLEARVLADKLITFKDQWFLPTCKLTGLLKYTEPIDPVDQRIEGFRKSQKRHLEEHLE